MISTPTPETEDVLTEEELDALLWHAGDDEWPVISGPTFKRICAAARKGIKAREIHIVFDGPPGPTPGRFVEVETPDGKSCVVGEWRERTDGCWALVLELASPPQAPTDGEDDITPEAVDAIQVEADKILGDDTYEQVSPAPSPEPGGVEGLVERLQKLALREMDNLSHDLAAEIPFAMQEAADEIEKISKERDALREALKFYADKFRYDNDTQIARGDGTYDISCSVLDDEGAIARAALTQDGGA